MFVYLRLKHNLDTVGVAANQSECAVCFALKLGTMTFPRQLVVKHLGSTSSSLKWNTEINKVHSMVRAG